MTPAILAIFLCAWLLLGIKMDQAAQPRRLELARRGEALLASSALPEYWKSLVDFDLSHAFGARRFLLFCIVAIPFAAIKSFTKSDDAETGMREIADKETRLDLIEFCELSESIYWLNNPFIMTIVSGEMLLASIIYSFCSLVLSNGLPRIKRRIMLEVVHEWTCSIASKAGMAGI